MADPVTFAQQGGALLTLSKSQKKAYAATEPA